MTKDVDMYEFLLKQKPLCTQFPLKRELGEARFQELRLKYKHELGFDLMESRCSNTFNCLMTDECVGRPFPKDSEIHKALQSTNVTITESQHRGKDVYLAQPVLDCSGCPFKPLCEEPCPSVGSYFQRSLRDKNDAMSQGLVDFDAWESGGRKIRMLDAKDFEQCESETRIDMELPWDCLSNRQEECLKLSQYDGVSHIDIGYKLGIKRQVVTKHIDSAMSKLEEWGKAREALKTDYNKYAHGYYVENKLQKDMAAEYKVSQPAIARGLSRWKNLNNLL